MGEGRVKGDGPIGDHEGDATLVCIRCWLHADLGCKIIGDLSYLNNFNNWYQSQFLLFKGRYVSLNMTSYEGTSSTKVHLFDGTNFSFWKVRMRTYIMSLGADVWDAVDNGYVKPVVLASRDDKLEFSFNAKEMNTILSGLTYAYFVKVMHLESVK